jgi:ABC-type transport system substrate-binding protein
MPAANPNAQKGGTFRYLQAMDPVNFGIWDSANGNTLTPSVPITDSLLDKNEYEEGKSEQILSNLAYDWWTDAAGTTWTFKIKEGVKFTDGKDMTCADWEFSLETIRDVRDSTGAQMSVSPRAAWLKRARDISCADSYTLQIKTDGALPSLPATLAVSSFAVLPKHIYEGHLDLWLKEPIKVGVGAFMFDSYSPTEMYTLKRNPNYWNQPYPYLDSIQLPNMGSQTAINSAFQVGRGEYVSGTSFPKATRDQMEAQGKIYVQGKAAGDGFLSIEFNHAKAPFNDPRFHLAVRCAVDSAKEILTGENGQGFEGPIAPLKETPGGPTWGITLAEWKALGPCFGPTAETDMAQRQQIAKDLLAQMGFNAQNPAKPDTIWPSSASSQVAWPSLEADLRAVNILPNVAFLTNAPIYARAGAGEFDMGTPAGFVTSRRDPDHWFYEQFYSTSDRNYGRYTNAETDALIDAQSRELDPAKRAALIKEAIITLTKNNAKVIVRHSYSAFPFASWVKDVYWGQPSNNQNTSAKFLRVWIDQAKMKEVLGQ